MRRKLNAPTIRRVATPQRKIAGHVINRNVGLMRPIAGSTPGRHHVVSKDGQLADERCRIALHAGPGSSDIRPVSRQRNYGDRTKLPLAGKRQLFLQDTDDGSYAFIGMRLDDLWKGCNIAIALSIHLPLARYAQLFGCGSRWLPVSVSLLTPLQLDPQRYKY
jgi:hypothetical protein